MTEPISICLRELRGAADVQSAEAILETFFSACGIDAYLFHDPSAPLARRGILGESDPSLTSRFEKQQVWRSDPLQLRGRSQPLVWHAAGGAVSASADANRIIWMPVLENGYQQAVLVPIHGPGFCRVLSVLLRERIKSPLLSENLINDLILLAHHLNIKLEIKKDIFHDYGITDRENQCLYWTSEGKTAWEVGYILGITERTVNFHLQNAMKKLDTCSKYEAVLMALRLGIIVSPMSKPTT